MTKLILNLVALFFFNSSVFSQFETKSTGFKNLSYDIRGAYSRSVTIEKLSQAKKISDLIEGYPSNWISGYQLVETETTRNGKLLKATSKEEVLTSEQKQLLANLACGEVLAIKISYFYKDPVNGKVENKHLNLEMTVIPEIKAEYFGGYTQVINYLKENSLHTLSSGKAESLQLLNIRFTVNEKGEVTNARVAKPSNQPEFDKLILNLVSKMPQWKPAETAKGQRVKQDFYISVGNTGC